MSLVAGVNASCDASLTPYDRLVQEAERPVTDPATHHSTDTHASAFIHPPWLHFNCVSLVPSAQ